MDLDVVLLEQMLFRKRSGSSINFRVGSIQSPAPFVMFKRPYATESKNLSSVRVR